MYDLLGMQSHRLIQPGRLLDAELLEDYRDFFVFTERHFRAMK